MSRPAESVPNTCGKTVLTSLISFAPSAGVSVTSSSACDLPSAVLADQQIDIIPFNITAGDRSYSDAIEAVKNAIIKDRSLEKYAVNDMELKAIQHLIK